MSSQTVYFNNPADITRLQNDSGYGQTITANGIAAVQNYINTTYLTGKKGAFFYGGNVKSDQEFFHSSGLANPSGPFTLDTVYSWASASKTLTGIITVKMIEDGLIKPSNALYTYGGSLYQGTGYYYNDVTISSGAAFPYDPASYTTDIKPFMWDTVTVADAIHMNIGLPNDFFMSSPISWLWSSNVQNFQGDTFSKALVLQWLAIQKSTHTAFATQSQTGTTYLGWLFATTGPNSFSLPSFTSPTIEMNKSMTLPAAWRPGVRYSNLGAYNLSGFPGNYDFGYWILGDITDKVARSNGYTNLQDYCVQKIFTPLGMTNSHLLGQSLPNANSNIAETSFQRSSISSLGNLQAVFNPSDPTTWSGFGCDPAYRTASTGNPFGVLAWASEYPNDLFYRINGIIYNNYYYPNAVSPSNSVNGSPPLTSSIRDIGKIYKCLANKGAYKDSNGAWKRLFRTESWNYMIAPKLPSNSVQLSFPTALDQYGRADSAFCLGTGRTNRDLTSDTRWGYADESTIFWGGASGCIYMIDFYTGNWLIIGSGQIGNSTQSVLFNANSATHIAEVLRLMTSP